ncbi:MAG: PD-(D/E)XK nuclease family protein [Actinomycetota bacterium]
MAVYSYSKLETFKSCPLRYKFTYIDRIKRPGEGIEAFMGKRIHEVLEKLYADLQYKKQNSLNELLADYESRWKANWHDNVNIKKEGLTQDNYFEMGRECIRAYYERYQPFNQAITLGLERKVVFFLDPEKRFQMVGYIDRLDQRPDGTYEIHDYKSSNTCPEQTDLDADEQLALYQIALKQAFTDAKDVELVWHYLVFDKEFRSKRTPEQLEDIKRTTIETIMQIEAAKEFEPSESSLCDWCDYPDLCPRRKHFYIIESLPMNEYANETGYTLVNKLAELEDKKKALVKEIDGEIVKIKEALIAYAKAEGVDVIRGVTKKAKVKIKEVEKYPYAGTPERKELEALLASAGCLEDVMKASLDLGKLAKAVKSNIWSPELIAHVKKFAVRETECSVTLSKLSERDLVLDEEMSY